MESDTVSFGAIGDGGSNRVFPGLAQGSKSLQHLKLYQCCIGDLQVGATTVCKPNRSWLADLLIQAADPFWGRSPYSWIAISGRFVRISGYQPRLRLASTAMKTSLPSNTLIGLISTTIALGCLVTPVLGTGFHQEEAVATPQPESVTARFSRVNAEVGDLFFAVEVGDDTRALHLISSGADLTLEFGGMSLMDFAVRSGRSAVFQELVARGVPPISASGEKWTVLDLAPLHQARFIPDQPDPVLAGGEYRGNLILSVSIGDKVEVAHLLAEGADVNKLGEDGWSALHAAASTGHGGMVRLLIEKGANFDLRGGPLGRTPLEMALQSRGNDSCIKALLDAGVKLAFDQEDARGTTLLHLASQGGYLHIMRKLIASGAITNAKSCLTPAKQKLVDTPVFSAVKQDETDAVVMLIRRGAELDVKDHLGGTPLWHAKGLTDGATTRTLVTGGADPNLAGQDGESPLLEALRSGKEEKARVLLEMGADPDASHNGMTGLHLIASGGTWEMATWLLDAGANPGLRNNASQTPFELAILSGNDMVAHVLVPKASAALVLAVGTMDSAGMLQALQLGANPTQTLSDGSTPMHQFARQGEKGFEAAKIFLAAGASPNATDAEGITPLSELIHEDAYVPFIELLMESGADPRRGSKPANMLAKRMGDDALMKVLARRMGVSKVPVITRSGFPHPAAQAGSTCLAFAGLGDYANALKQADFAVDSKPSNGRYRLYRAKLRVATGDTKGALVDYSLLMRDKPSWSDPKVDYGVLLVQSGFYAEGLSHLDEVMARFVGRTDAKLHLHRGRARAATGDLVGALQDLELAHQTAPANGEILRHLGLAQQESGDLQAACSSWKKSVEAGDPDSVDLVKRNCVD